MFTLEEGVHALLFIDFQYVIPIKWAKVHPPFEKLSRKKYSEHERNDIFRSFCVFRVQIYSSLSGPFQVRSLEWEVNGTYNGFTTDLLGRYI